MKLLYPRLPYLSQMTLTFGFAILMASGGQAAEIKLMSSGGMRVALIELIADFERATKHKVTATYGAPGSIRDRAMAGESVDVLVLPTPWFDGLVKQGKIVADSKIVLASSGIG